VSGLDLVLASPGGLLLPVIGVVCLVLAVEGLRSLATVTRRLATVGAGGGGGRGRVFGWVSVLGLLRAFLHG
jgi:hypothetical protein